MSVTMEEVRTRLDVDEVDYPGAAEALGPEALPHLRELAQGLDPMLASKAIYLASMFGGEQAAQILQAAIRHDDPVRRVAAASGMGNLDEHAAEPLVDRLLEDADVGVRKVTLKAITAFPSPAMKARVQRAAKSDPEQALRHLAAQALDR